MAKNILGNKFDNEQTPPPNDGVCPKCNDAITKSITGLWHCKKCDWTHQE
ncbi:MAG: hypothetical protein FWE05_13640 [Defluviitaleaceae bacterium]|nr:hypothetical protein [Defluviitaleaceae bacterium]